MTSWTLRLVAQVFLPPTFRTGLLGTTVDGIAFAHEPWASYCIRAHGFRA